MVSHESLTLNQVLERARIEWHGVTLHQPDWGTHSHSLAFTVRSLRARFHLHVMVNAYWEPLTFELPPTPALDTSAWRRCIDTALESPDDIHQWAEAPMVQPSRYDVQPRSVVLLASVLSGAGQREPAVLVQ